MNARQAADFAHRCRIAINASRGNYLTSVNIADAFGFTAMSIWLRSEMTAAFFKAIHPQ